MSHLERNYVFEFSGMPKSGKTTALDIVSHYLRRRGVPIDEYHGGGRYCPIGKDDLAGLNLYLAAQCIQRLASIGHPTGSPYRIYLLDRGPVDRLIFTAALGSLDRLSLSHQEAISSLLSIRDLSNRVDLAFIFVTSPELSIERENMHKILKADGRVMNTSMLEALRDAADRLAERSAPVARLVERIDTEQANGEPHETALKIVQSMSATDGLEWLAP